MYCIIWIMWMTNRSVLSWKRAIIKPHLHLSVCSLTWCKAPLGMCWKAQKGGREKTLSDMCKYFLTHLFVTRAVNISWHLSEKASGGYVSVWGQIRWVKPLSQDAADNAADATAARLSPLSNKRQQDVMSRNKWWFPRPRWQQIPGLGCAHTQGYSQEPR